MGTTTTTTLESLNSSSSRLDSDTRLVTTVDIECKFTENDETKTVTWDPNTIDNEHMNRKSSKCCCIFTGKKEQGYDSSSDEGEDKGVKYECKEN